MAAHLRPPRRPTPTSRPSPSTEAPRTRPVRSSISATAGLQFQDENGAQITQIDVVAGETIEFVVDNTAGFDHNFYIGPEDVVSASSAQTDLGIPTWPSGVQSVTWTVESSDQPLQFACTVPGHYAPMHGDIVIQG